VKWSLALVFMMQQTQTAITAAKCAGAYLLSMFGQPTEVHQKGDTSFVSDVDLEASRLIESVLRKAYPDYALLDEEMHGALHYEFMHDPTWVVDPLDGTSNFLAGIPIFGVAIALVENLKTKVGVIFDPLHDELFVAEAGGGATLNGKPIHVSNQRGAKGGMLFAGRGYKKRDRERHGKIIYDLEQKTTYFRRLGCATHMLSSVASGRADSVILTGNNPWDVLSGALLVQEAGGRITDYCGIEWSLDSGDLIASNGTLHQDIVDITRVTDTTCL
jgi:myo-inositol-1(or 4)-monophosphatase